MYDVLLFHILNPVTNIAKAESKINKLVFSTLTFSYICSQSDILEDNNSRFCFVIPLVIKEMNEIYSIENLDELSVYLGKQEQGKARSWLLGQFDKLYRYANIKEWNDLVRVCEALNIVGWGDREPLEAKAQCWINGSFYTSLMNRYFEIEDEQGWSRLKDSYVLENGSDKTCYAGYEFKSQRNLLPKSPVRWQKSGNYQKSVQPLYESLDRLKDLVVHGLRSEKYGDSFSYLGISMFFSHHDDENESVRYEYFHSENEVPEGFDGKYYIRLKYKWGRMVNQNGVYHIKVECYFSRKFGELPLPEQKRTIIGDFLYYVKYVSDKLQKKKIGYDCNLLKSDLEQILMKWENRKE